MATTTGASRSFPTLRYLAAPFRWFFRSRRRMWAAAAVLLAIIVVPPLWWSLQLVGLPDIGDPFDVAAFRSLTIPDDRNAFVLYRQAADRLKPFQASGGPSGKMGTVRGRWPKADPAVRHWLEENREAMELYRRGSDRPDALYPAGPDGLVSSPVRLDLMDTLLRFALLEGSRLEEQGDMAGAWVWYRAALRATYHVGLRGTILRRRLAQDWKRSHRERVATWAADGRTTPAILRRALHDVIACAALLPSDSYTVKAEYPRFDEMLDSPTNSGRVVFFARLHAFFQPMELRPSGQQIRSIGEGWRTWRRESERSHRVLRLAYANWLAYYELPPNRRPKPQPSSDGLVDFYAFGPEAPANARALSPTALDRWLASTMDADGLLRPWSFPQVFIQDLADHRALVVLLASELYRRDHGTDPPSDEALVGAYLEEHPDDGLGQAAHPATSKAGEAPGAPGSPGRGR